MKKLLLLATVCLMGFGLYAESEQPIVIIHKSNGGWWAWLNLYNEIVYTPQLDELTPATLDCMGAGFSSCRVPRQNTYMLSDLGGSSCNINISPLINDAINEIIAKSEDYGTRGTLRGTASKKIAVRSNNRDGGMETFVVKGSWSYNAYGEGTMKISILKLDVLDHRI